MISSAFQSAAAKELYIEWQPATSIRDLDVIARWARENLRSSKVAVMGHNSTFFDELVTSDRRSLLLPSLEHNEFESHGGVMQARFTYDLRDKEASGTAAQVGAGYQLVVRATLAFLDGILRKDQHALVRLDSELPAALAGAKLVHVAHPRGLEVADLLREIRDRGVAAAGAHCAATPGCNPGEVFAEAGAQLLTAGEAESALKVLTWLTERQPDPA